MKKINPSATLTITSKAKAMKAGGLDVINFGAGEPDFDTPDYIKDYAIEAIRKGKTKYTPSTGTVELRKAICKKLLEFNKLEYEPDDIIVSNGAKHTLYNIFQAICDKGDEVIIPSPYWVSYPEMVNLAGAKPVFIKTSAENKFKLTAKEISPFLTKKTKALILNSPSNPTGSVYSGQELEKIFSLLADSNLTVVADEIYERLIYDGLTHTSFAALNQRAKEITILVNGVSKTYAMTGWRIGYLASSDKGLTKAIKNLQDHSTSNPSSISQEAALAALTKEDDSVESMKKEFKKRRDYMFERIEKITGLSCVKPQGSFYCFVDVSKIDNDSLRFAKRLLEDKMVAVIPGEGFGAPGYIRLSFATSLENIEKGLDRIEEWVKQ
ncbi:MAG: pyridoxal phosphate-dependent aminotransferase [Candidatus Omnitrophota bacterium]